jgi:serine/threonine-protein kinase HipA
MIASLRLFGDPRSLDPDAARDALDFAETSTDPKVRQLAAHVLLGQPDSSLRGRGRQLLWGIIHSDVPEPDRVRAAIHLKQAGDPSARETLATLAASASDESDRLRADQALEDEELLRNLADSASDSRIRTEAERLLALLAARRDVLRVGRLRRGIVSLSSERVGLIEETAGGGSRFTYDPAWISRPDARPISPTMPPRSAPYEESDGLLPFFENLLPEGFLLQLARRKLGIAAQDVFGLLLATCSDCIGAVEITPLVDDEAA